MRLMKQIIYMEDWMISIGTFNKEYEQIIFYGCITIEIDKFLKCCDYKKCVIVDSNYKLWNTEYKNIPIVSIEKAVEFVWKELLSLKK